MKTCSKCGETKPLSDYYKQAGCKDGVRPYCKACDKARMKATRDANLGEHRQRDRERYANDPARQEAQKRTARAQYKGTPEQLAARRAHYEANRDTYSQYRAKRKALKAKVETAPYSRRAIYDRDGGSCRGCHKELPFEPHAFHIDHIVPIGLGGPDTPANVQLMCPSCNRRKWMVLEGQIHFGC